MRQLGTVLPTVKSLAADNAYAEANKVARTYAASRLGLTECAKRQMHGETRYYRDDTHYAVIGQDLRAKWFETRIDGDYRITQQEWTHITTQQAEGNQCTT